MATPQLRDTYLSWKGVVGDLVPMYSPGRKRKKYVSWIMSDIDFSSLLAEAAVMEAMWRRASTGTGLTQLGGVSCLEYALY